MKTVLITGSSGFVGPYLVTDLQGAGYKCYTSDRVEGADFQMDVTDYANVLDVLKQTMPDNIIHLAGFSSVKGSFANPELCKKINVEGTRNMLNAIVELKLEKSKLLVVSSSEVYINKASKISETDPLDLNSPYAQSRAEQESVLRQYDSVNWLISRSFPHIGPKQQLGFVVADFASQIIAINKDVNAPAIMKVGNLSAIRDFSDVRDIVRAYRLLLENGRVHEVYNVTSGNSFSILEILDKLLQLSQRQIKMEVNPELFRPSDTPIAIGDNTKLMQDTGWKPEYSIDQTIKDIYQYWANL